MGNQDLEKYVGLTLDSGNLNSRIQLDNLYYEYDIFAARVKDIDLNYVYSPTVE